MTVLLRLRRWPAMLAAVLLLTTLNGVAAAAPEDNGSGVKNGPAAPEGKDLEALVEKARNYFDLDEDVWRPRIAMQEALKTLKGEDGSGYDLLKDMAMLRTIIYQGRFFRPQMTDKKWQRNNAITEFKRQGGWHFIKSEELNLVYSLPKAYPKKNKEFGKGMRSDPWPALVTLNEKEDYTGKKYPGFELLKRRYPKSDFGKMFEHWVVMVPVAPAGNYFDDRGGIRRELFTYQYGQFLRHTHVDFDRIILDGAAPALAAAPSQSVVFSGFIFRKGAALDDESKALVKNYAAVPVFVIDNPKLAEDLKEAGHPNVTTAKASDGAALMTWMATCKRVTPKKFSWNLQKPEHQFAWWVNLEQANPNAALREIDVEVVDTEDDPNTINIEAKGITRMSLFLNDEILDLSRKVRVVVNGNLERDEMVERDLDLLFSTDPFKLRESMYFGFLFPGRMLGIKVRARKKVDKPVPPKVDVPKASPEEEKKAETYYNGAVKLKADGKLDGARKRLERILSMPANSYTDRAKKLLEEIGAG